MAFRRTYSASVREPQIQPGSWHSRVASSRKKFASEVLAAYSPDKWLLTHVSIVASVDLEPDSEDPAKNWRIIPEHSFLVNNNGDAWERELLKKTYRTFIGANNYCFVEGTRVLMADGTYKPIEQVKVGDKIINRFGTPASVSSTFVRQANNLLEIQSGGILSRSLFVTGEHPFWAFHARNTCPKTGRPNSFNRLKLPGAPLTSWVGFAPGVHRTKGEEFPSGLIPGWVEAQDLDAQRDFLAHPVSPLEIPSEEINVNRAILIGWFLAEGFYMHTYERADGEDTGITFALGNDEYDVALYLSDMLQQEFGQYLATSSAPRIYETESGSYTLSVSNRETMQFFKKWCGKYSWAKKMPEEAMYLPKDIQALILRYCIEGDGCGITPQRGYRLELKAQSLIQQLMWICWRLGLKPNYREQGVLPRYTELEIVDGFEVYTEPSTGKKSRPGYLLALTISDSIKMDELCTIIGSPMRGKTPKKATHKMGAEGGEWLLSNIDSIQKASGEYTVYNFEVEGDNSYIAEGVVVHNCEHVQIPSLAKGKVIDAALREVDLGKKVDGSPCTTLYVDLLIATSWEHDDLCRKILSGEFNAVSMGCFLADTRITLADGSFKNIQDITAGDSVRTHTGGTGVVKNLQIREKVGETLYRLSIEGTKDTGVTGEHPYWVLRNGTFQWVEVKDLVPGDTLLTPDEAPGGTCRKLLSISTESFEGLVYNFEVEGDNSYIANDVAVHNCLIQYSTCTRCGNIAKDEAELCVHVRYEKRNTYYDRDGKARIVAELCGCSNDPKSVTFIDASWVRNPAFPGAVLRNIISPPQANMAVPQQAQVAAPAQKDTLMTYLKDAVSTDTQHHSVKAASVKKKAADEDRFGLGADKPADDAAPAADAPAGDAPAGDAPAGDAPAGDLFGGADQPVDDAAPAGDAPEGDKPVDPAVAATPLDQIKKEVMDGLMGQIKQDLLDSAKKMQGDPNAAPEATAFQDGFAESESLVKSACSYEATRRLWDKYSIDIQTVHNRRLAGALLLASSAPLVKLASFGYNRRDVLGLLVYLDRRAGASPLSDATVHYIGMARSASESKDFFRDLIIVTGREPSVYEARKVLAWQKLLNNFG